MEMRLFRTQETVGSIPIAGSSRLTPTACRTGTTFGLSRILLQVGTAWAPRGAIKVMPGP